MIVRDATEEDAAACAAIYAPYVAETSVSFELEPPTPDQMALRINRARHRHTWLVLVVGERRNGAPPDGGAMRKTRPAGPMGAASTERRDFRRATTPAGPSAVREPTDIEVDAQVVGFAYGHPFAERPAYRWSCEVSIYLERQRHRSGGGRLLYETLLARLADRGYRRALAGMTLPNDASVAFHGALGFEPVGVYRRVGWKNGSWHDVAWMQKTILEASDPPAEPR